MNFQLNKNDFGHLTLTDDKGGVHNNVVPVRAYPISAPDEAISIVDTYGHEHVFIEKLANLPETLRLCVKDALESREFMPVIEKIIEVSCFTTPSTWQVETNRGKTQFILKNEESIRRLAHPALLITDKHSIHFLIPDRTALDSHSRKILDRFL